MKNNKINLSKSQIITADNIIKRISRKYADNLQSPLNKTAVIKEFNIGNILHDYIFNNDSLKHVRFKKPKQNPKKIEKSISDDSIAHYFRVSNASTMDNRFHIDINQIKDLENEIDKAIAKVKLNKLKHDSFKIKN